MLEFDRLRAFAELGEMETQTYVVLALPEYDMSTVEELERELAPLNGGTGTVDLRGVAYIDSSALRALVRALKRMRDRDSRSTLTLVNAAPRVKRIVEIAGLSDVFILR
jgi:anti-anti-sigma factor